MKKLLLGLVLLSLFVSTSRASGEQYLSSDTKLGLFIRSEFDEDLMAEEVLSFEQSYERLVAALKVKQESVKSNSTFLKHVFYTVHRKMLGTYEKYVTFSEIFKKSKKYDCVTGTALYALILDDLGIDFEVHETDYHVYLLAYADGMEFLFESTDPLNGFAWNPEEIAHRKTFVNEESMRINAQLAMSGLSSDDDSLQVPTYINNVVDLRQLAGLHYYNQGLKAFNDNSYRDAFQLVIIAQGIYPSDRIKYASAFMFSAAFED